MAPASQKSTRSFWVITACSFCAAPPVAEDRTTSTPCRSISSVCIPRRSIPEPGRNTSQVNRRGVSYLTLRSAPSAQLSRKRSTWSNTQALLCAADPECSAQRAAVESPQTGPGVRSRSMAHCDLLIAVAAP
ncbi:hypothetical protein VUR80DRAFT_10241 [Thermomyces stellatus]